MNKKKNLSSGCLETEEVLDDTSQSKYDNPDDDDAYD